MTNITKVGIGVAVFRSNPETGIRQVLLGLRKGSHGAGEWGLPGGSMEHLEGFEETAYRELEEEVGPQFEVSDMEVVSVINLTEYAPKHYIDFGLGCWHESGDPVVMEPDKCEKWEWFDINNLPSKLFATVQRIVNSVVQGTEGDVFVYDKRSKN